MVYDPKKKKLTPEELLEQSKKSQINVSGTTGGLPQSSGRDFSQIKPKTPEELLAEEEAKKPKFTSLGRGEGESLDSYRERVLKRPALKDEPSIKGGPFLEEMKRQAGPTLTGVEEEAALMQQRKEQLTPEIQAQLAKINKLPIYEQEIKRSMLSSISPVAVGGGAAGIAAGALIGGSTGGAAILGAGAFALAKSGFEARGRISLQSTKAKLAIDQLESLKVDAKLGTISPMQARVEYNKNLAVIREAHRELKWESDNDLNLFLKADARQELATLEVFIDEYNRNGIIELETALMQGAIT